MKLNEFLVHGDLHLPGGSLLQIENGRDLLVHVWEGSVWLTQERDQRDILLKAGEWFRLDRQGRCVVEATKPSAIALTSPHAQGYAAAIELFPADGTHGSLPRGARSGIPAWVETLRDIAAPAFSSLFRPQARRETAAASLSS